MDATARRRRIWKILYPCVRAFCRIRYRIDLEPIRAERPYLLAVNHSTNFLDILFAALASGTEPMAFVASEHILRHGRISRLLQWALWVIARPKGAPALRTVRDTLNTLKDGIPVCLFAEGNASWDGRSMPVVEGTGSLVRAAGVPLVDYRLEGAYLCRPRWSRSLRRGRIRGRIAGIYPPEALKEMTTPQINRMIEGDIRQDTWEAQALKPERLPGRRRAEYLERLLYMCPGCRRIGTLHSRGNSLACTCGAAWQYTVTGFLEPGRPFRDIAAWEDWQKERLRSRDFTAAEENSLFSDPDCALSRIEKDHRETPLGRGMLVQREDALTCAGRRFALADIREMDMVRHHTLLFTAGDGYYQIRGGPRTNLRKYLEVFRQSRPGRP